MIDEAAKIFAEADAESRREKPDFGKAVTLMRRAADLGHSMARYALATWYLHGKEPHLYKDYDEAFRLLEKAAKANIPAAFYDIAVCYAKGEGVEQSSAKAFENYLRAALHGDADAVNKVGQYYYFGIGTSEDRRIAEIWFDRAEELGTYEPEEEQ